jgi:HNH endonuclease
VAQDDPRHASVQLVLPERPPHLVVAIMAALARPDSSVVKRRKGIRPKSEKRVAFEAELDAVTDALYARAGHLCEICRTAEIHPLCADCRGQRMADWCEDCAALLLAGLLGLRHHRLRRGQGGTNDLSNLLALCEEDHKRVHAYPTLSYDRGWLLRSSTTCAYTV